MALSVLWTAGNTAALWLQFPPVEQSETKHHCPELAAFDLLPLVLPKRVGEMIPGVVSRACPALHPGGSFPGCQCAFRMQAFHVSTLTVQNVHPRGAHVVAAGCPTFVPAHSGLASKQEAVTCQPITEVDPVAKSWAEVLNILFIYPCLLDVRTHTHKLEITVVNGWVLVRSLPDFTILCMTS